jgi:hypothetical protein
MVHFDGRRGIDGICEFDADGLNRIEVRYHGSPSPIVQIQERHVPELKSRDEHYIIHRASTPPRIRDHRDRKHAREAGLNWAIDT